MDGCLRLAKPTERDYNYYETHNFVKLHFRRKQTSLSILVSKTNIESCQPTDVPRRINKQMQNPEFTSLESLRKGIISMITTDKFCH